jgi:hypothetical protein
VSGTWRATRTDRANVRVTGPVPAVAVGVPPVGIVSVTALPWPLPVAVQTACAGPARPTPVAVVMARPSASPPVVRAAVRRVVVVMDQLPPAVPE